MIIWDRNKVIDIGEWLIWGGGRLERFDCMCIHTDSDLHPADRLLIHGHIGRHLVYVWCGRWWKWVILCFERDCMNSYICHAFQASVLAITPPRLPGVAIISMFTCPCHSLPPTWVTITSSITYINIIHINQAYSYTRCLELYIYIYMWCISIMPLYIYLFK